jgi:hypothetical protein
VCEKELVTIKIEAMSGELPQPFAYGNVFVREEVRGLSRLCVGVDGSQDAALAALADGLLGPFQLLYVLHTTRTGAELGRYESPDLIADTVQDFLRQFGRFLCEDSRHDVWVRSHDDDATLVLDRHNLIYAYGPLDRFESALQALGVRQGESPVVPDPHVHHYHQAWDGAEGGVVRHFNWQIKPLQPTDVQFEGDRSPR